MSRGLIDELLLGSDDEDEGCGGARGLPNGAGGVRHEKEGDEIDEIMRLHHLLNDFDDDEREEALAKEMKGNKEPNIEEDINDLILSLELEDNDRYLSLEQSKEEEKQEKSQNDQKKITKALQKSYQDR
jgi:hypothetical protein